MDSHTCPIASPKGQRGKPYTHSKCCLYTLLSSPGIHNRCYLGTSPLPHSGNTVPAHTGICLSWQKKNFWKMSALFPERCTGIQQVLAHLDEHYGALPLPQFPIDAEEKPDWVNYWVFSFPVISIIIPSWPGPCGPSSEGPSFSFIFSSEKWI